MSDLAELLHRYAEIDAKAQEYAPINDAIEADKQETRQLIGEALDESGLRQVAGSGFLAVMERRSTVDLIDPRAAMDYLESMDRLLMFMKLDVSAYRKAFGDNAPGLRVLPKPTLSIKRDKSGGP